MNLSKATFTAMSGCHIQIEGIPADIETKPAMLMDGVCFITALSPADAAWVESLNTSPCGQDGAVFGCNEPRLVELAARYNAWLSNEKNAPWADTTAAPLTPLDAAMAFQQYLSTLNPS